MRINQYNVIIIFASLSSILIVAWLYILGRSTTGFTLLFIVFWIITITFLIQLKNWARIAYIIIHIILASITLLLYIFAFLSGFDMGDSMSPKTLIVDALIPPLIISYFIIAIKYFSRSDTAKLFALICPRCKEAGLPGEKFCSEDGEKLITR